MSARRKPLRQPLRPADLVGWRNRNRISLAAIAEKTKIGIRYLEAIECGKFRDLPGGTYDISYLRQYAQAIHFDADRLVELYRTSTKKDVSTPAAEVPATKIGKIRGWIRRAFAS